MAEPRIEAQVIVRDYEIGVVTEDQLLAALVAAIEVHGALDDTRLKGVPAEVVAANEHLHRAIVALSVLREDET